MTVPPVPSARPDDPRDGSAVGRDAGRSGYIGHDELTMSFDAFYKESRDRLVVQTLALTGDLAVARSAVREAFVVTWHHWRKHVRNAHPETIVREVAWRKALRRTAARPWHRRKGIDEDSRAVLEALAALPVVQRKALLLTQLAADDLPQTARELGVTVEVAERELQLGAARFAVQLDIPTSAIHDVLARLADVAASVTWPRVTIIRRAGLARRRAHTAIGATAAVVLLITGGALALDDNGARPTLDREAPPAATSPGPAGPVVNTLPDTALLSLTAVQDTLAGGDRWTQGGTSNNSSGTGRVLPCQASRYADQRGTAAWVRAFRRGAPASTTSRTLLQFTEASGGPRRAARTYARTLGWFTTCPTPPEEGSSIPRIQLMSTASVADVGDEATLLVLRSRTDDVTHVIGVARTGLFTTTTALSTPQSATEVRRGGVARLLATAIDRLCVLADGGACATDDPKVVDRPAYPTGRAPWFLSEIDLPPLNRDQGPWVGTPPARLAEDRFDSGAIGCATPHLFGRFRGNAVQRNQFRTFVFSAADLPPRVGLTQTVGALPRAAARRFVATFRDQMVACPDADASAGTEVEQLAITETRRNDLSVWHLRTALPGGRSVDYDVALLRRATAVSVLVYVAAPRAQIADADFVDLAQRSLDRLGNLPAYKTD